jgi:hypothetical protein
LALVVYLLCKDVKRSLSVRPSLREALAWLTSAQRGFAVGITLTLHLIGFWKLRSSIFRVRGEIGGVALSGNATT